MKIRAPQILRLFRQVAIAVVAAILFWTTAMMIFEEKFIFFPSVYPSGNYEDARSIPKLEDCWLRTEDGVKLHGWFAPADSAIATLVMFHGNAGNISHRIPVIKALRDIGFNVFMIDYRGYGKSEGSPDEQGVYRDGRAAYEFVASHPGVDSARIILFGTSLGGAVAVDVAVGHPAFALILESTFSSARDVARVAYPFLPVRWLLRSRFDSAEKIRSVHVPVLVIHGDHDSIIPFALGQRLFDAANDPKKFFTVPGAGHNDLFWVGGRAYLNQIRSFVIERRTTVPSPRMR
jgi:fermentation-respiration switch protein FrsA (DUF1100 family)